MATKNNYCGPLIRTKPGAIWRHAALVIGLTVLASTLLQAQTDFCKGGTLDAGAPLGTVGPDLVITSTTCTVDGSSPTYNFHNVNIFNGGSLVFADKRIKFYAESILVQNRGSLQAGVSNPIGTAGGQLEIHLYGSLGDPGITCETLDSSGQVVEDPTCGVPSAIWSSNTMSTQYPSSCVNVSQLTPPQLLPGNIVDCFYPYMTLDNNDGASAYFGHKVLALSYGGSIELFGAKGADYNAADDQDPTNSALSWARLNATLKGSEGSLTLDRTVDWQPGDNIVITPTDYLPGHAEQLVVGGVSGATVSLQNPVSYPHWGQEYSMSEVPANIGPVLPSPNASSRLIDTRAAVGLLSRSIRIVSDGDTPGSTLSGYFGGHTLVRQGFLAYQIQGVEFYQLGEGGLKLHYPVHFHMARRVPANTFVKDSSIWDSMTRWITIHATQGVTLQRNVGYKSIGHGFYMEDGTEVDNHLHTNLGVFARAAVQNTQNDRSVPGILDRPGDSSQEVVPYHSDWDHPTVFWIMNSWNDFQYNFAAGAGTCGVCYWFLPGATSGASTYEYFAGYAGQQLVNPHNWTALYRQSGGIHALAQVHRQRLHHGDDLAVEYWRYRALQWRK